MDSNTLTDQEKLNIESLNVRQIINQFPQLVLKAKNSSKSYRDMLVELGISPTNTSAKQSIKKFLEDQGEELPNYRLYQTSSEYSEQNKTTKQEVLKRFVAGDTHIGSRLRKWVLEYNLLPYKCSTTGCLLSVESNLMWNGEPLTLDLDHINGINTDNRLDNLRWLCPNCHSQTPTYKGKNKRIKGKLNIAQSVELRRDAYQKLPNANDLWDEIKHNGLASTSSKYNVPPHALKIKLGEFIGDDETVTKMVEFVVKRGFRVNDNYLKEGDYLASRTHKATYPPVDEMVARVTSDGYESLARELEVSGNAIRKYLTHRLGYTPKRAGWGDKSKDNLG